MLFNSFQFLLFLPTLVIIYYFIPSRYRWILLLISSYFFYMCWKPEYALLLLFSTIVDFSVAKRMEQSAKQKNKKMYLFLSLATNLGLLFSFKYLDFFIQNTNSVLDAAHVDYQVAYMELLLPVGISFYTFQTLSYTIDVYNGKLKAETHFGKFAVFVSFWPQLVAGPIERAAHLLPELKKRISLKYENIVWGTSKIIYGFFKKVVIADRLSLYVNSIYGDVENASSIGIIIASVFFAFQIYCDFSGYSDIAIGSAKLLGIDLMENFKRPYLANSFSDFWKRWHISLSSWFRDYVYIPLGGNRTFVWKWHYNLFITFIISGFWHGANWTFIIWGGLHGIYQIIENILKRINLRSLNWFKKQLYLRQIVVFLLVVFAWIFFRATNFEQATQVLAKIIYFDYDFSIPKICGYKGPLNLFLSFFGIGLLFLSYQLDINLKLKNHKVFILVGLLVILFLGKNGESEFIYFQF